VTKDSKFNETLSEIERTNYRALSVKKRGACHQAGEVHTVARPNVQLEDLVQRRRPRMLIHPLKPWRQGRVRPCPHAPCGQRLCRPRATFPTTTACASTPGTCLRPARRAVFSGGCRRPPQTPPLPAGRACGGCSGSVSTTRHVVAHSGVRYLSRAVQ